MDLHNLLQSSSPLIVDRDKLIKSYGLHEQFASDDNLFKDILDAAAGTCNCDSAYISLVGESNQHILSQKGKRLESIPVKESFSQFMIESHEIYIISDRSKISELCPHLKTSDYYAGYPLINSDNIIVGSLCVTNTEIITLSQNQIQVLKVLSDHVIKTLDSQRGLVSLIKNINKSFKPAACADLSCLQGELAHLQTEVVQQKEQLTKLTKELKKSNRRFEKFAHTVAHDFKAPLRTIISFNQIVKSKLSTAVKSSSKVGEYLQYIESAGKSMEKLVTSVLDFSSVKSAKFSLEPVSLNKVLETVLLNLHSEVQSKSAIITLPNEDSIVMGNEEQIAQLFQNFIGNSLKYQKDRNVPEIKVVVHRNENKQVIEISDNGIGIEEQDMAMLFEPFTRLHSSSKYEGSGIGLATCKAILENHKSNISVESKVGLGTILTFTLPVHG